LKGESIKEKIANLFELPKDVVLDLPRISIIGNLELNIENHRGIIEYEQEIIRIRIQDGQVIISGKELIIESLTKSEVGIKGYIKDVTFKCY
jgi:sporulation protein YqfC